MESVLQHLLKHINLISSSGKKFHTHTYKSPPQTLTGPAAINGIPGKLKAGFASGITLALLLYLPKQGGHINKKGKL